jgi:purine-nucleoside phosphorylase
MPDPVKDILFIRQYPTPLEKARKVRRWIESRTDPRGTTATWSGRRITFYFPGVGTRLRRPHPDLISRINAGQISDIVDVGGAGALDPRLNRGDLVLSSKDFCTGNALPLAVKRRGEIKKLLANLARRRQANFHVGCILTHHKLVLSRTRRLELFQETGCSVVQMEHCWFLRTLQECVHPEAFASLHVTHIEMVSDAVPQSGKALCALFEYWHGINTCVLSNQRRLGQLKREFLELWLGPSAGKT